MMENYTVIKSESVYVDDVVNMTVSKLNGLTGKFTILGGISLCYNPDKCKYTAVCLVKKQIML